MTTLAEELRHVIDAVDAAHRRAVADDRFEAAAAISVAQLALHDARRLVAER